MIRKYSSFLKTSASSGEDCFASVYTSATAEILLSPNSRKQVLQAIKKYTKAPDDYFDALYLKLINNVAEYVQALPDLHSYGQAKPSQLLDSCMARAAYSLLLRQHVNLPDDSSDYERKRQYSLWTYVSFSAAFLWQIGRLHTHYHIDASLEDGTVKQQWFPHQGSLLSITTHYRIRTQNAQASHNPCLTSMLAKQLMPEEGYDWIARHPKALAYWLEGINYEGGATGAFVAILSLLNELLGARYEYINITEHLTLIEHSLTGLDVEIKDMNNLWQKLLTDKSLPPVKVNQAPQTQLGEEFLHWLQLGVENKTISINQADSLVHKTEEGIFLLYPEIFKAFCESSARMQNWNVVYKQFLALNVAQTTANQSVKTAQFHYRQATAATTFSIQNTTQTNKVLNGLLLNDELVAIAQKQEINKDLVATQVKLAVEAEVASANGYPELKGKPSTKTPLTWRDY